MRSTLRSTSSAAVSAAFDVHFRRQLLDRDGLPVDVTELAEPYKKTLHVPAMERRLAARGRDSRRAVLLPAIARAPPVQPCQAWAKPNDASARLTVDDMAAAPPHVNMNSRRRMCMASGLTPFRRRGRVNRP